MNPEQDLFLGKLVVSMTLTGSIIVLGLLTLLVAYIIKQHLNRKRNK